MKVIYDDKCSICNKEIKYYKSLGIKNTVWIGIHKDKNKLDFSEVSKENYLKKMHVVDDNNDLKIGVDAFIVLWQKHAYFKYLALFVRMFPVKQLATLAYNIFAKVRYDRLYKSNKKC